MSDSKPGKLGLVLRVLNLTAATIISSALLLYSGSDAPKGRPPNDSNIEDKTTMPKEVMEHFSYNFYPYRNKQITDYRPNSRAY
jgi:hypothetical protein